MRTASRPTPALQDVLRYPLDVAGIANIVRKPTFVLRGLEALRVRV